MVHLLADLDATRERGYSTDDEETTVGLVCLAVPVRGFRTDSNPFAISVTVQGATGWRVPAAQSRRENAWHSHRL